MTFRAVDLERRSKLTRMRIIVTRLALRIGHALVPLAIRIRLDPSMTIGAFGAAMRSAEGVPGPLGMLEGRCVHLIETFCRMSSGTSRAPIDHGR